jgi:heme/copper-type cytochrome/quinol oxidase subunit 3
VNPRESGAHVDVSELPSYGYSHASPMWWGTLGMIAIESTVFALVLMCYFYLRFNSNAWPMSALPPDLTWGTINTFIMLASLVPNELAKKASEREDLNGCRIWMLACILFGLAFIIVRAFEFSALNVRWDSNAYGSIVWLLLGLHTVHIVTDWLDTVVLDALFFIGPLDGKRFPDVSENSFYWYFVVASWLPIYFTIYWGARALGT